MASFAFSHLRQNHVDRILPQALSTLCELIELPRVPQSANTWASALLIFNILRIIADIQSYSEDVEVRRQRSFQHGRLFRPLEDSVLYLDWNSHGYHGWDWHSNCLAPY